MFKDFRFRVGIRVAFLGLTMLLLVFMAGKQNMFFAAGLMLLIIMGQLIEIYYFISLTNRKLTRFLESVKYQDFISGFTTDNKLGKSFKDLNVAFNEVLEAFRKARSEKEEHWQYLNSVVQQVRTGIISFDSDGNVQLINSNARKFVGHPNIKNLNELQSSNNKMFVALREVGPSKSVSYKEIDFHLTIHATEIRIRGNTVKLITLQNIQTELQKQELDAWQNLTRVLRHEIMNSITPISSLTSTLREILDNDMDKINSHYELKEEAADDLREGLSTIENRSKGLIKFIDAYREYTSLPQPKLKPVLLRDLIGNVAILMRKELNKPNITFESGCESEFLSIQIDEEMIEQVIINLMKNAIESIADMKDGRISVMGKYAEGSATIEVCDNGPGIITEAIGKIFVPFFTTKKTGSGIGLSLSRQILQMHNGSLTVDSEPGIRTVFLLRF
jgi:two-component system, NtrC family, nitrogen regulation sensor histidine kinase NtrY